MLGMVSTYNRDEHSLIGGEIGAYVKRLALESGRDLVVIRYNKLEVFCIIEFLSPNRDVFIDILNLQHSLANFDHDAAIELRHRLFAPITTGQTAQGIVEEESNFLHGRQDDNLEAHEREARMFKGEI